jgi:uncharacterized protein (DUF885 family)
MDLKQIIKDYLQIHFSFNPTHATKEGYAGFDEVLPDLSKDNLQELIKQYKVCLKNVSALSLDDSGEKIEQDLLKRKLQIQLYQMESVPHFEHNPAYYVNVLSSSLFDLMMSPDHTDSEKVHCILKRLEGFPTLIEQAKENLQKPIELWTSIAKDEIQGLFSYIKEVIEPYLKSQNQIATQVIQNATEAIFTLKHHLNELKTFRKDFAIGQDNFEFILKTFHGIDSSANEIKEIGFKQLDEISKQLSEQAEKIDPTKSWQQIIEDLKNSYPSEDDLLTAYQHKVKEIKKFLNDKDLVTVPPEETLKVIETPAFLQSSIPYAAYSSPAMFAKTTQGIFFVSPVHGNKELLKDHCNASFPLTTLHEAYPGHHLQFSVQKNLKSPIHKLYEVSSYYEGWTLYCEEMMYEQGFYDDGMRLFQLKDKLWRAARIIVDVSMQCYGMSDAEAAQFLVDNAKLSERGARIDVNWYTQYPTIPMSYLVGMLQVKEMRDDYVTKGNSLKEFHDAFLSCGAIPLNEVKKIILPGK